MCACTRACTRAHVHTCFAYFHVAQFSRLKHSAFTPCFLQTKSHVSKCKKCVMLQLLPNVSVVLKQIHIFETSVIAELTCLGERPCTGTLEGTGGRLWEPSDVMKIE